MSKVLQAQYYTARQVAKAAGCPDYLVDRYDREKIVQPSVRRAAGSGRHRPRLYSFDDVVCMAVAARLRRLGMSTSRIRLVVKELRKDPDLRHRWLVSDGKHLLVSADGQLVDVLKKRQLAVAVFLEPLHRIR